MKVNDIRKLKRVENTQRRSEGGQGEVASPGARRGGVPNGLKLMRCARANWLNFVCACAF